LVITWFLGQGCGTDSSGGIPKGWRLISGSIVTPTPQDVGTTDNVPAFQLVAVHDRNTIYYGEPFDVNINPGGSAAISFRLAAPCDKTVSLHFQRIASSSANVLGTIASVLQFQENADSPTLTTLLPWEMGCTGKDGRSILLGTIHIDFKTRRTTIGGEAGGTNPLIEVDTNGNGKMNFDDPDDDSDGIPDAMDPDEDGDGIPDMMEGILSFMMV
jgi:hypothetical protein